MKKVLSFLILGTLFCMNLAIAAPKTESVPEKPMDWSISMNADGTDQAPQGPQWSLILENDIGVYAYDMGSLTFGTSNGREDRNLVQTTVKTVFTNEDLLKKMNKGFAKKLTKKEKTQYCLLQMEFNLAEKTYTVHQMDVYGSKGTLLETKADEGKWQPVPEKSFAEAMLEICSQAAAATPAK
ncbi:MAG: hypothetical protein VZQ81_04440 [Succiniclasticum sp.]|nr:hypothetical protein [Succiniclasticum sp.]